MGGGKEERVLYIVISEIRTCIDTHVAKEYLLKIRLIGTEWWTPNLDLYKKRVRRPQAA